MVGDILQPTHLLFVLVVALLVLGPKKLPEVGRQLGNGLRDFRAALNGEHKEPEQVQAPYEQPASDTAVQHEFAHPSAQPAAEEHTFASEASETTAGEHEFAHGPHSFTGDEASQEAEAKPAGGHESADKRTDPLA
jgi:sec-independent protein translocase protein TatA